jgi:type VI secretion system protein ImpA
VAIVNVESLLKPLAGDNPCGENLRWDRAYLELETIVKGKEVSQFDNAGAEPEEPDWREVRDKSVELLGRGRQLRILVLLTLAAIRTEGYAGLRDGLAVIRGLLEQQWDHVWPVLDVEDNNDPTERVNSLSALWTPLSTFGDSTKFLDRLDEAPLWESRQTGRFALRDIKIASGTLELPPPKEGEQPKPRATLTDVNGSFMEADAEAVAATLAAIQEASGHATAIEAIFTEKCGAAGGVNLELLRTMLRDAAVNITRRQTQGADAVPEGDEDDPVPEDTETPGPDDDTTPRRTRGRGLSGDVASARDVNNALASIIRYYEQNEKSSPVPLFMKAAQQVVDKDFMTIHKLLTPDVVSMLNTVATPPEAS